MKTWRFSALDSLFFREARPFDSIGGSELSTVFPPSPVTLAGAIRSAIGSHQKIHWASYAGSALETQIGGSDSLGSMRITGVFLSLNKQRLYPVPAHLVVKDKTLYFLQVGKPVQCDLGEKVHLAVAPKEIKGIKPLENYWLTETSFAKTLNGSLPDFNELIPASDLFERETHLGIGRDNETRAAKQGLLYQTQHVRPKSDLAIEVDITGLETVDYPKSGIVRLGGEGRGAAFTVDNTDSTLPICSNYEKAQGIKLILLSTLFVEQAQKNTPLPNFEKHELSGQTVWKGKINGIELTLHCAIIGKTVREGGWDLQKREPKPVRSFIPAGSVFYCKVDDDNIKNAIKQLHEQQIKKIEARDKKQRQQNDLDMALGRGLLAVCPWFANDSEGNTK